MSKSITAELTKAERRARMEQLVSYLTSGQPWPLFTEEYETDLTFSQCKAARDEADAAVEIDKGETRLPANFAGALYRDAQYAHAGRNFLLKQSHHNAFRELYEGGKTAIDNEKVWKEL